MVCLATFAIAWLVLHPACVSWAVSLGVWMMETPARAAVLLPGACHRVPAAAEFTKIASATAIGFAVMGFIGYFVRLLHIPVNNILIGMCCSPGCLCRALHAPELVVTHSGSSLNVWMLLLNRRRSDEGRWPTRPYVSELRSCHCGGTDHPLAG